jgi:microcin C transport system substrate-binding protein
MPTTASFSRRPGAVLGAVLGAVAVVATAVSAPAVRANEAPPTHHGYSLVGPVKYGPDFPHFGWVNPDAPKGGTIRLLGLGTFDSLNQFAFRGQPAAGLGLVYDQLFSDSPDEPTAQYGLVAEWMRFPADYGSVTFRLREGARWHDGRPITVEDVIWSMDAQKTAHPRSANYYKNVVKAEKTGEREVTFTFDSTGNRELPHIVGELTVLPKHWWTADGPDGKPRDLSRGTTEFPLGSGPYRVKSVDMTRGITYERVADWWAKDLSVSRGQWNFDEIRIVYFRDRTPAFEEFKAGKLDVWNENRASAWASQYEFDAVKRGLVRKEALPQDRLSGMQAFVFNTRRAKFADPRVRRAFNLVFNFEAANQNLFFGQYVRTASFFEGSELAARGLPQGRELELLTTVKDLVPPEVFTTEWKNPVNTPDRRRANMAEAQRLLTAAGWTAKNGTLVNAAGEELTIEFLLSDDSMERIATPFVQDLKLLGVKGSVRIVDPPQYKLREDTFDFDAIVDNFGQSLSPGNEQRDFWGSEAAGQQASRNTIGIRNPAVDTLIDAIVFAKDRAELIAACRALDRVLLWNHYVVPQWSYPYERLATWNIFGRPARLPSQSSSVVRTWWIDTAVHATTVAARGGT